MKELLESIPVKASEKALKGEFSNMVQVSHTKEEFIIDILNVYQPEGRLVQRIIVTPQHMERIIIAMKQNLEKYEDNFGKVNQ